MSKKFRVLLYYKYQNIEDPEKFRDEHLAFCNELGLKGRIIVGYEGINGTVSGTVEQTEKYKDFLHSLDGFEDVWFKEDEADDFTHPRMSVKFRKEIVSLNLEDDFSPNDTTGKYLNPKEFKEAILDENTVILDTRNDYEYDMGHFKGAVRPDIKNFRDLPEWIKENEKMFKDKNVAMYCTGGVRCEKFSGWMLREGISDNVAQLHGGIDTYGKDPEVKGELWEGSMYVFDERISVPINHVDPTIIGRDYYDGEPCERYRNCANPECNRQIFMSEENEHKYLRSCSEHCRKHPKNRYAIEHNLSMEEWEERLNAIGESLKETERA